MTSATRQLSNSSPATRLRSVDAYRRAANYLTAGQIYLMGNPLLRTPLARQDIKPRPLGHWALRPG